MKHIIRKIDEKIFKSALLDFYFEGMSMGSVDIETTGLSASRSKFVLGGLYNFETKEFHQFFAESADEEAEALKAYVDEISRLDAVITYNGKHFDIPFIEARYKACFGQSCKSLMPFNFDIYLLLNGHSPVKKFVPNLKQKTIENYLGLWDKRMDEISGADSVDMFLHYQQNRDPELLRQILLHNSDDVMQLTRILRIITKCDFHKGMQKCGFPAEDLSVSKVHLMKDKLRIQGLQRKNQKQYTCYEISGYPAGIDFDGSTAEFRIDVPVTRYDGMAIIDLKAAGLDTADFEKYPAYGSGLLAIEIRNKLNHMEINHFVIEYIKHITGLIGGYENGIY